MIGTVVFVSFNPAKLQKKNNNNNNHPDHSIYVGVSM
jgi:hypothetical protein